jgi:hypothetical protein
MTIQDMSWELYKMNLQHFKGEVAQLAKISMDQARIISKVFYDEEIKN